MGIRFNCHACGYRLNVKAFLAGKRGICPKCGAKVDIPAQGTADSSPGHSMGPPQAASPAATGAPASHQPKAVPMGLGPGGPGQHAVITRPQPLATAGGGGGAQPGGYGVQQGAPQTAISPLSSTAAADAITEAPHAVWYVRPPAGGQYGPASGDAMRRWLNDGRISPEALVWREGWPDWRQAGDIFPSLRGAGAASQPTAQSYAAQPTAVSATATSPMAPAGTGGVDVKAPDSPVGAYRRRGKSGSSSGALAMLIVLIVASIALIVALVAVLVLTR